MRDGARWRGFCEGSRCTEETGCLSHALHTLRDQNVVSKQPWCCPPRDGIADLEPTITHMSRREEFLHEAMGVPSDMAPGHFALNSLSSALISAIRPMIDS